MNNTLEIFTAASHQDVLALVTQIAILLFTARMLGEIAQRLNQPAVVGELMAGIILDEKPAMNLEMLNPDRYC